MKQIIGKKQTSSNDDFVKAWNEIESLVSLQEAQALVDHAVADIRKQTAGKRAGYAWSGGKDSLALQYVCEKACITDCVIGIASKLEYPQFLAWIKENSPKGLAVWDNAKLDLQWLAKHQDMLFPTDSKKAAQWFHIIQHRAQAWFFKEKHLEVICLGRRTQDGNYTGGKGQNCYTDRNGVTRLSPIADWKHEEVLAVIHYFMGRNIPPIYDWKNGFTVGTGVWAARQWCGSVQNGWQEVYGIAPQIVEEAAQYIESAKQFLNAK